MSETGPTLTEAWAVVTAWYEATGKAHTSFLRWRNGIGHARHGGVGVDLHEPPAFEWTKATQDITYLPGMLTVDGLALHGPEMREVARRLEQMASDARDALNGHSTLAVVFDAR